MKALLRDIANHVPPLDAGLTIGEARPLLLADGRDAIPLIRDNRIVGCVARLVALTADTDLPLIALAEPVTLALSGGLPIREAAEQFRAANISLAWVTDNGHYVGYVTAHEFLGELGRSFDSLTGLPQSDTLREWGEDLLERGHEITILFIDLNDFKMYNKRFGHVIGDRVLQALAARLTEVTDRARELVVRYGGDEFAIGTTLDRKSAEALAELLKMEPIHVEGVPNPVGFSIGIAGGRRHGRVPEHGASMVDDLINSASRDSLKRKAERKSRRGNLAESLVQALELTETPEEHVRDVSMVLGEDGNSFVELIWVSPDRSHEPHIVRRPLLTDLVTTLVEALKEAHRNSIRIAE
ncbi:MAG: diguanylate cyclase [Fimbriimonadaceae bacterium]|nr:diguanylate cyclase [Fimbriimonadaceae bacterium]